jgi:hypothetical protein
MEEIDEVAKAKGVDVGRDYIQNRIDFADHLEKKWNAFDAARSPGWSKARTGCHKWDCDEDGKGIRKRDADELGGLRGAETLCERFF